MVQVKIGDVAVGDHYAVVPVVQRFGVTKAVGTHGFSRIVEADPGRRV